MFPAAIQMAQGAAPMLRQLPPYVAKATPQLINMAVKLLKGMGSGRKEDIANVGRFAEIVQSGKYKGNLGQLGQTINSFTENIFGKEAGNWTNPVIKNALDQVMQKLYGR